MAYTPGVGRVCRAIAQDKDNVFAFTSKANSVAVVTDGSAVLGLGNLGPEAALPVMEGKVMLFKEFADIDGWPICLDTQDTDLLVHVITALSPSFGGINLEDISAPRCFEVEDRLKRELDIPVMHDDQHGTAVVLLAALLNALKVVGKEVGRVRVVVNGLGAAGTACCRAAHWKDGSSAAPSCMNRVCGSRTQSTCSKRSHATSWSRASCRSMSFLPRRSWKPWSLPTLPGWPSTVPGGW